MARVLVATQPWGVIWQTAAANPHTAAERTLQVPAAATAAAIDTPVYVASSGATLVSSFVTDAFGRLPGWVDEGTHSITVGSDTEVVEASSGTAGSRADAAAVVAASASSGADAAVAALDVHLADAVDAHDASAVSVVPGANGLTATDVQSALAAAAGRLGSVESGDAWIGPQPGYVLTIGGDGVPVWGPGGTPSAGSLLLENGNTLTTELGDLLVLEG